MLEWDPIELATATLRSLTLFRNNSKAGAIPNPSSHTSTKISGLAVDTEYNFYLILRTSAGTYSSDKVSIKTHKMTDLSGITVCPGVMPAEVREGMESCLERIGARPLQDSVRIDTTHFVCTEGRGQAWERAQEMNIPVVRPEWLEACEREGRIVVARQFYLGAELPKIKHTVPARNPAPQPRVSPSVSSPRSSVVAQGAEKPESTTPTESPVAVSAPQSKASSPIEENQEVPDDSSDNVKPAASPKQATVESVDDEQKGSKSEENFESVEL